MSNTKRSTKKPTYCDFCNKPSTEVGALIEGPGSVGNGRKPGVDTVHICVTCLDGCMDLADHPRAQTIFRPCA